MTKHYTVNEEKLLLYKRRRHARSAVTRALKNGVLKKSESCELCKEAGCHLQSHHVDYGKVLEVTWLCTKCHGLTHRKNHPLNPRNHVQTPMPYLFDNSETVTVLVTLPVKNFLLLNEIAEKKGVAIARLIKNHILEKYPLKSKQLEMNFEARHDITRKTRHERIQSLEANESRLHKSQRAPIRHLRSKRRDNLQRVDGEFFGFLWGHGADSTKLQRTGTNR